MPKTKKRKCKKNGGEPPEKKYLITNPTKQDFIDIFGDTEDKDEYHWKNKDNFFLYKFPLSKQTMDRIYYADPYIDDHDGQLYSYGYIHKGDCNDPYNDEQNTNVHTDTNTILCEANYINKYKSLLDKSNPFSRTYDTHSTGNKVLRFLNKYKTKNKDKFFKQWKDNKRLNTISPSSITATDFHSSTLPMGITSHNIKLKNSKRKLNHFGGKRKTRKRKTRKRKTRKTYT
jgi:hypothetical protein